MIGREAREGTAVLEIIKNRRSCRAFQKTPVPKEVLTQVMEAAINAPSWANTQPWEFAVVGGEVLQKLNQRLIELATSGAMPNPDVPFPSFPDAYTQRMRANGRRLYAELGIERDDRARQASFNMSMTRFFDAPNGIVVYVDKALGPYSMYDAGLASQNLMLAAEALGLGTCPEIAPVRYPDVVRQVLEIPSSKQIVLGIAIGYPADGPAAKFRSERAAMGETVIWRGFE